MLAINTVVHHRRQRVYGLTHGQPHLVAVGRVTRTGHTANEGNPFVEVCWEGPDGGTDVYRPKDIVPADAPLEN